MPGFNGTGPMGAGPRTGGGFGYCTPNATIGVPAPRGIGRGAGRAMGGRGLQRGFRGGRSGGRCGWGLPYYGGPGRYFQHPAADEASLLRAEADELKARLDAVERRMAELDPRGASPQEQAG